jgi:hypothetical protein
MPPEGHDLDVRVSFDPDYEDMVAEIYLDGHCVALISQDEGRDRPTIEIFPGPATGLWKLPLADLEAAISHAKRRLSELRSEEQEKVAVG